MTLVQGPVTAAAAASNAVAQALQIAESRAVRDAPNGFTWWTAPGLRQRVRVDAGPPASTLWPRIETPVWSGADTQPIAPLLGGLGRHARGAAVVHAPDSGDVARTRFGQRASWWRDALPHPELGMNVPPDAAFGYRERVLRPQPEARAGAYAQKLLADTAEAIERSGLGLMPRRAAHGRKVTFAVDLGPTAGFLEVGLMVQRDAGRIVVIEVKIAPTVTDDDVRHLHWLGERLGPDLLDAIVVTPGRHAYRRRDGIAVVPAALLGP